MQSVPVQKVKLHRHLITISTTLHYITLCYVTLHYTFRFLLDILDMMLYVCVKKNHTLKVLNHASRIPAVVGQSAMNLIK